MTRSLLSGNVKVSDFEFVYRVEVSPADVTWLIDVSLIDCESEGCLQSEGERTMR